jgi:hypothetical protein
MRVIGKTGARVRIVRHGYALWRGLVTAKGWQPPRRVSFLDDLRGGRITGCRCRLPLIARPIGRAIQSRPRTPIHQSYVEPVKQGERQAGQLGWVTSATLVRP